MEIGEKLRELRIQRGLTQEELGDRCELSKGFISQVERGQVSPSVTTLFDLIECLGSSPSEFFKETEQERIVFGEKDFFEKTDPSGTTIRWIVPSAQSNQMEPLYVTIGPHQRLEEDLPHPGEEFGYVLSGHVILWLGSKKHDARAGESFYFKSDSTHYLENPGSREAKLIWVSTPPSF